MAGLDPVRLSKTIAYLLRHLPPPAGLTPDADGWFDAFEVARVVSRTIHRQVRADDVTGAAKQFAVGRLEVAGVRVRATPPDNGHADRASGPDLLFHAVAGARVAGFVADGHLFASGGGTLYFSRLEAQAWRVAHRAYEDPVVLFVDAARARRDGVQFHRTRSGLYNATRVPLRHVLNLREGFAEQASAGGFLVDWTSGRPRIALIRVTRRGGATWEVAKGKMEAGEAPRMAAARELREEMGIEAPVLVSADLGTVRYGFYTREGEPRLKTIFLFMLELQETIGDFCPAAGEGIDAVRWFELSEALDALAHPSLRASIGRLLQALDERARALGLDAPSELRPEAPIRSDSAPPSPVDPVPRTATDLRR